MVRVVNGSKRAATDPLKHSQPLGGVLALLGVARCLPLLHGAQGCTAFTKALLTRHFREPIPVQTSAVTEISAVLGSNDNLHTALDTVIERYSPDVIGVLTTGVTEVSGADTEGALRDYRRDRAGTPDLAGGGPADPGTDGPLIVAASTPDFAGGLSDGWSATLRALVTSVPRAGGEADPDLVAVPVGVSLSAVDLDDLAGMVRGFGLRPVLVPDLSRSLDGHLAADWSPLTTGGTNVADLRALPTAGTVLAVGATAAGAGAALAGAGAATGADLLCFDHCCGLAATDALVAELMARGRGPVPEPVRHWRRRLADGLLDAHFVLGGARVAIAAEPEYLVAVGTLLAEVGAEIVAAVAPTPAPVLEHAPCAEVVVGDLADLEERAADAGAELVVASSHGRDLARRIGAAHLVAGFPVYDRLGVQLRGSAGYAGSLHLPFDAANRLLDHRGR